MSPGPPRGPFGGAGYEKIGRDGLTLSEKWRDQLRTFHGFHIHGFPNGSIDEPGPLGLHAELPVPDRRAGAAR